MNEYEVTLYYTMYGSTTITVEAEDEDEAMDEARCGYIDVDWDSEEETDSDIECTAYNIDDEESDTIEYNPSIHRLPWQAHDKQPSIED